ncbi:MAG: DUF1697 domain-containing protein [Polyangiales bacterium]
MPTVLQSAIAESFGYHVPAIIRSAAELELVARGNAFEVADPKALHLVFLSKQATMAQRVRFRVW